MIKLEKNAQGNIRANSFNNLRMIFEKDELLRKYKVTEGRGFNCVQYFLVDKADKAADPIKIDYAQMVWLRAYIDEHYHYVPSKKTLMDFFQFYSNC